MDQIVILPPHVQDERKALKLLGTIRHYMEVNRFSLGPLMRAILWEDPSAELQFLLGLLIAREYMTLDKGVYEMTPKGLKYFPADDGDDESGFHIEFHTCETPPTQARRDPRNRRR